MTTKPWGFAADNLAVNQEVYRDRRRNVRKAHGGLRRDTPIFRMGETVKEGEPVEPMVIAMRIVRGQSFDALLVKARNRHD